MLEDGGHCAQTEMPHLRLERIELTPHGIPTSYNVVVVDS